MADVIDDDLATWARWCLASPSLVACNVESLECTTGVQQGEPLSPLLFCAGISPLIQTVADYFPQVEQLWYLDDGLLYGDAAHVSACLVLIQKRLQLLNMELNLQKCELYTNMEADRLGDLQRVPRVLDTTEWSYLGAPLGQGRHSKAGQSALERAKTVTAAICQFGEKFPLQALCLI